MKLSADDLPIQVFEVVSSTNDTILDAGEAGEPEGVTHIARLQTRGRGRGSHSWWSPRDAGLWMSTLLRPTRPRSVWGPLALLGGCAVRRALVDLGVAAAELYWPNDLRVGRRKIGGVLGEIRSRGADAWVALGVGVNIDLSRPEAASTMPAELRNLATSMVESGPVATTNPVAIARRILARFWPLYQRFEEGEEIASLLEGEIAHAGRSVEVRVWGRTPWRAVVEGLGPVGELLVRPTEFASTFDETRPHGNGPPCGESPPPGGDWHAGRRGIVAVTGGEVIYEDAEPAGGPVV